MKLVQRSQTQSCMGLILFSHNLCVLKLPVTVCCRLEKLEGDGNRRVYTWEGFTLAEPVLLKCPVPHVGIKTVSLGQSHGALLTLDGQLFMFGSNDHGQIGLSSDTTTAVADPSLLSLSSGIQ